MESPAIQKTAIYYRVSSALQTTECQKPDIAKLLQAQGLTADFVYEEQASAAKHRPEFERLLADASARKFSTLVIWALDRFGRSMVGNMNDFLALDRLGIRIISVREPWLESSGPVRQLLIGIFSWAAEQERARLIERTKAGIAVARTGGKAWGRRSKAHALQPGRERDREAIIRLWADEGRPDGYAGLAVQLGGCSPMTARSIVLGSEWAPKESARD